MLLTRTLRKIFASTVGVIFFVTLILSLCLWYFGPMLAIGEWRPFDSILSRIITIAIFWVVTAENASAARFSRGPTPGVVADTVAALRWVIIGASYALILGLIFVRWMDFWLGN